MSERDHYTLQDLFVHKAINVASDAVKRSNPMAAKAGPYHHVKTKSKRSIQSCHVAQISQTSRKRKSQLSKRPDGRTE
uniref:Uncharacterized protein n=1 Tax=Caenorhabditis japonica TaxID=281687 RepID=A0A8R1EI26_CAEJA